VKWVVERRGLRYSASRMVDRQRLGVDHHAGLNTPAGSKSRLTSRIRAVSSAPKIRGLNGRADAAVAVLGGVDAVELGDEVDRPRRDLRASSRPAPAREVDERADVQAADRAVAVEAGVEPVAVEDRRKRAT
jgi:hypothetical protein